jgi:hypothetical protein
MVLRGQVGVMVASVTGPRPSSGAGGLGSADLADASYLRCLGGTQTVTEPGWTLMRSFLLTLRAPPSSS